MLKRIAAGFLAAVICALALCSCFGSVKDAEGAELIKKARSAYKELNSARVIMTNTGTGEIEQEFVFKYDEKDILLYSYKGKSEKNEYAQYNNGMELFTYQNGEQSYLQKGENGFVLYNRSSTHPQADEGLILYSPAAVTEATVTDEAGVTHIRHVYDVSKIGAQAESGEVTGFSADYYFKGDELLYFVETTDTLEDGAAKHYAYKVEITEKNAVEKVENTVLALTEGRK
ncbi:MAG: hypothetical protein IKP47_08030 [Ruminococcus sp.]|nr:hypothetical protein [Ruminococcus sp.]